MGREGGSAGGRCKYVHVSSVALARVRCPAHTARPGLGVLPNPPVACLGPMALTPPANPPSRPWTVFCAPREDQKKNQRQKPTLQTFLVSAIHAWRGSTVSTKVDTYQQQRRTHSDRSRKTVEGGVGPVAGVSAAKPPGTGLRRPPPPDPPRHPSVAQLLTLPLRVQGAALPEPLTLSRLQPPQCGDAPAMPAAIPLPPADHRRPAPPRTPDRS